MPKRLFMKNIVQALGEGGRIRQTTEIITRNGQDEIAQVSRLYAANTFPLGVVSDRQMTILMKDHGLIHQTGGVFEVNQKKDVAHVQQRGKGQGRHTRRREDQSHPEG